MDLKKFLKQFIVAFLCVNTAIALSSAARFPADLVYYLLVISVISIIITFTGNLIKFFTIPENSGTRLVAGTLLVIIGVLISGYIANNVGFSVSTFESLDLGLFVLKKFTISETAAMIIFSVLTAALVEIFYAIDKK
ncbi:hypothetical protein JW962_00565 [Candidatus Dojkabacteria bacterium]|nr:hypothetical protein [Candidatus Dojkabacteria bacterium]